MRLGGSYKPTHIVPAAAITPSLPFSKPSLQTDIGQLLQNDHEIQHLAHTMANERSLRDSSDPAAFKQDGPPDTKPIAYIKEEQTSSDESRVKQKPDTRRHRASVACTSCRDRRIRCVVPTGKKACVQCERSSTPCIIKDDDERRRPISRAYVYSLVERVALLEKILRDEGLRVPQPNYPPETRQHSRRSEPTVSADKIASFSSTPQDSSVSDDQTASSPCYSTVAVQDEHQPLVTKKRTSAVVDADHSNYQCNKKMRHDSLIMSTDVKEESPVEEPLVSAIHYDEPFNFNHTATITPPIQTPFWPMEYDHNGGLTLLLPESQERVVEYRTSSVWESNTFGFHGYNCHPMPTQCDALPGALQLDASSSDRRAIMNLDFMPLTSR